MVERHYRLCGRRGGNCVCQSVVECIYELTGVQAMVAYSIGDKTSNGALTSLYDDVRKHLTGDAFWVAEILLDTIERETGFKGRPRDRRDYEHG